MVLLSTTIHIYPNCGDEYVWSYYKRFFVLTSYFHVIRLYILLIGMREWQRAKRSTISILSFGTAIFLFVIVGQSFFD